MITILAFIVVLGILVFVHEFGHFIVAKKAGVRCEVFSLGFGPAIFKKQWGETLYQIAIIPLGGFVKMSGEDPAEELAEAKEKAAAGEKIDDVPPERKFHNQPIPVRLAIVLAGPMMNLILAFLLVPLVYMIGIEVDATLYESPAIAFIETDSPAAKAGLQAGDVILSINHKEMRNWKEAKTFILFHPAQNLEVQVRRAAGTENITVKSDTLESLGGGTIGIHARWPSVVKQVMKGKPAAKAGMQAGDKIVKLDRLENPHWFQTQEYIQKRPGKTIRMVIERNAQLQEFDLTPEPNPQYGGIGLIGIEPQQTMELRRFGLIEAFKTGTIENIETTITTFVVVGKLFTGNLKIKAIGGPVQIAEFTGAAAEEGIAHLILFMAFISVQLGIMNLLPIPVLDGGHVFFMLIESLKGSPLSIKKRMIAQQVSFVLLIALMVVVTFNDVARHQGIVDFFHKFIP